MKTRLTPEDLSIHHDGLCGVSIGDGPCACLVHWVEALQKEADAAKLQATEAEEKSVLYLRTIVKCVEALDEFFESDLKAAVHPDKAAHWKKTCEILRSFVERQAAIKGGSDAGSM